MVTRSKLNTAPQSSAEVLTKLRAAPKRTIPQPEVITPTTKVEVPEEATHSAYARVRDAINEAMDAFGVVSWRRRIVAGLLGMTVYAGVFYGAMVLIDMMMLAVVAYTGVGFIAFLIAFLAMFAALVAATTVGTYVHRVVLAFDYANVKARVLGWVGVASPAPLAA